MEENPLIKPEVPHAIFHGTGPNGYFKLIYKGKKYVGVGELLVEEQKIGTDGRLATFYRSEHKTPSKLAPPGRQPVSIVCVGYSDQKRYRFRGLLRKKSRDALQSPVQADPVNAEKPLAGKALSVSTEVSQSSPAEGHGQAPQTGGPATAKDSEKSDLEKIVPVTGTRARRRPQDTEAAIAELKWVMSMIEAGIDANIKLSTICLLASKSRATLERELTFGKLPPPRIRGRLRYWSLNDVNAYLTGTWPATPTI